MEWTARIMFRAPQKAELWERWRSQCVADPLDLELKAGLANRVSSEPGAGQAFVITKNLLRGLSQGTIEVNYSSHGPNWTLSVSDDGVRMPKDAEKAKPGLGTSIVRALAAQLHGTIKVSDASPGTAVSNAHTKIAAVANDASPAALAV